MSISKSQSALVVLIFGAMSVFACDGEDTGKAETGGGANGGERSSSATGSTSSGGATASPSSGGTTSAEPVFEGSCVSRDGDCSELFDCPHDWEGDCPISSRTYSKAHCTTADLVGTCWSVGDQQNCGIKDFFYVSSNDRIESTNAGEMSCGYVDGVWTAVP